MFPQPPADIEAIAQDFELLEDWEDKIQHAIELGRALPPLDEADRIDANKVSGCASQVWLASRAARGPRGVVMLYRGDSDALIVRGLVALALAFYSGRPPQEIVAADAMDFFRRLGLADHLTQQRANGLRAMIARIRAEAAAVQG
ncbi:MAG: SufE family protein [Rhodoblastus sp.]|nr:MAG: SufE family protein [Rhodoblastus sp.]